ncbi:MAG: prenyltransferase/squalene oxidase repeat-containing protein [Promethearchaeota archaeon]
MKEISRIARRRINTFLMTIILFGLPLILISILSVPPRTYIDHSTVGDMRWDFVKFASSHRNPESHLFIEPDIETNYRVIDSINWSDYKNYAPFQFIDPRNNTIIDNFYGEPLDKFFIYYFYEKQNEDGGFSDVGGFSNMISTYEVIGIIDKLIPGWLDTSDDYFYDKNNRTIDFINSSMQKDGWGFKFSAISAPDDTSIFPDLGFIQLNETEAKPDIISTYIGIYLAKRFNANSIINNNLLPLSSFINSTKIGGYSLTNTTPQVDPRSTYFGIKSFKEVGMSYNTSELNSLLLYLGSLYNSTDGGYSAFPGNKSDVLSTYYVIASYKELGVALPHPQENYNFVLACNKTEGGFGANPDPTTAPDFLSSWAAMKAIEILEKEPIVKNSSVPNLKYNYLLWAHRNQAINGLFGQINLQSNYWGTSAVYLGLKDENMGELEWYLNVSAVTQFVMDCYDNLTGGYGHLPSSNASLYPTYLAISIFDILYQFNHHYGVNQSKTIQYISSMQNEDGGFKIGDDINYLLSLYGGYLGGYSGIIENILNNNQSTVESTYWAVSSLKIMGGLYKSTVNIKNLTSWILSAQNADGGFSIIIGFHSDLISTYYGLETLPLIYKKPLSLPATVEFLLMAQTKSGGFGIIPALATYVSGGELFFVTYAGAISIYEYHTQPKYMSELIDWYTGCISNKTKGVGDYPNFGADLRNTEQALLLLDQIKYDQSFDAEPWINLLFTIFLIEVGLAVFYLFIKIASLVGISIFKKITQRLGFENKLNISYLQKFPAVNCENLSVYAGGKCIIDSINVRIEHGEILGVLGESGAGKSTFIKGLLGMRETTGVCEIYGMDSRKNASKFRPLYGYVPQDLSKVYLDFTTMENLLYFGKQYGLTEKEIYSRGKKILRALDIQDKADELVKNLSGGQKRRVSIAIALVHNPIMCILDEPSSGLDPVVRETLIKSLVDINETFGTTIIVISHYPEESKYCHKVAIFGRNRGLIDFGKPRDLLNMLPGHGRTIQLEFKKVQEDANQRLENIPDVDKALELRVGSLYSIYTDLSLSELKERIEKEFGKESILNLLQQDAKMEDLFRYRAMEVPTIE